MPTYLRVRMLPDQKPLTANILSVPLCNTRRGV